MCNDIERTAEELRTFELNKQLEKVVGEIHHAIDLAKEMDERDELLFDLYELNELLSSAENICNTSEEIE